MFKTHFEKVFIGLAALTLLLAGVATTTSPVRADSGTTTPAAPLVTPTSFPATSEGVYTEWSVTISPSVTTVYTSHYAQVIQGELPTGMSLQQPNYANPRLLVIKGTPTFSGSFPIRLQFVGTSPALERDYTLAVNPMTIEARVLPNAQAGRPYLENLTVFGGTTPHQWTMPAGQLPQGLALSAAGVISGTPVYASPRTFTAHVADSAGRTASREFTLNVDPDSALTITTASLPGGTMNMGYSTNLAGAGGTASYTFSLSSGPLPAGLALQSSGVLSGTPTIAGTYPITVKITDAAARTATKSFTLVIAASGSVAVPSSLSIQPFALPNGTVGTWYGYNFSVTGGSAPYQWNISSGAAPTGLTFDAAGSLYGLPSVAGTYPFTVRVRSVTGVEETRLYTVIIASMTGATGTGSTGSTGTIGPSSIVAMGEAETRVRALDRIGIHIHNLVKLADDGNPVTQADSAVYYVGGDGRRHTFPNNRVYSTWYADFSGVTVISAENMASIPLGANVTYRPGLKMVKFMTDPKVYVVSSGRTLRLVTSETLARNLYGSSWNRQIDDIADTFYTDYNFGTSLNVEADFNPAAMRESVNYVSDALYW